MPNTDRQGAARLLSLIAAIMLAGIAALALWVWFDRPVHLQESWDEPLSSVSFAPYRRGQSPLTKVYPTSEQIEQDLATLVGKAKGIRTYTALEGMEVVPDMAAKLGLKVIFSAWLGSDVLEKGRAINEREIQALIRAANAHPNEIDRVIVGNEVLLRNDLKPQQLIDYIRRVKSSVKQPVSYADVWAFYLKYPEVGREVDFITIHILPFWEDEPVDIEHVETHVVEIVERIRAAFPGKPILIGEAGWPSIGRDRGPAQVSTVNEARFVRKMAEIAAKHGFDYNIVEAFDQPWKAKLENTVGAAWGIMDVDRKAKFGMSGPVVEVADWPLRAGLAIGGGALATLILGGGIAGFGRVLVLALCAQALSWLAVTACFHAEAVSFRWWQDLWAPFRGGFALLTAVQSIRRLAAILTGSTPKSGDNEAKWMGGVLAGQSLMFIYGVYALAWTVLLIVDGRYRDIPVIDLGVPALGTGILIASLILRVKFLNVLQYIENNNIYGATASWLGSAQKRRKLTLLLGCGLPLAALGAIVAEGTAIIGDDFTKFHPSRAEQLPLIFKAMVSNFETNMLAVMLLLMAVPHVVSLAWRGSDGGQGR